jgi:transketolase
MATDTRADAQSCINTIRTLAIDAIEKAGSGHPGMPMAMAPLAWLLYGEVMDHDPKAPLWPDRDRFILSAGHGSMLLYATLHLAGLRPAARGAQEVPPVGVADAGPPRARPHPRHPGVEITTGPLGQGFANGVGMAMAERYLRDHFGSEVQDHRVYAIVSDGDLMEGIASEAASLAGQVGLDRLSTSTTTTTSPSTGRRR